MARKSRKTRSMARTTISLPQTLKNRMAAVEEDVNWSALAAQAFEEKLDQIDNMRKVRTMSDVMSRLRASKKSAESEDYQNGYRQGAEWAKCRAGYVELLNLRETRDSMRRDDWAFWLMDSPSQDYSVAQGLYFAMAPSHDGDRDAANEFWDDLAPEGDMPLTGQWVRGFAEGALAVFDEVADQL